MRIVQSGMLNSSSSICGYGICGFFMENMDADGVQKGWDRSKLGLYNTGCCGLMKRGVIAIKELAKNNVVPTGCTV